MTLKRVCYLLKILFFIFWLLSLYAFFLAFFLDLTHGDQFNNFLAITVGVGVVSFILFAVLTNISKSKENNEKQTVNKIAKRQRAFLIIAILVFFIILNYLFLPKLKEKIDKTISFRGRGCAFSVVGKSMEPTLKDGWTEATDCCKNKGCSPIERGDLVVYYSKNNKEDRIKRIIGLPNEEIIFSMGKIYINGKMLVEPYLSPGMTSSTYPPQGFNCGRIIISEDKFFVLGDNRMHSSDSRDEGLIDLYQIKAIAKYKDRADPEKYFGPSANINDDFNVSRGGCSPNWWVID